MSYYVRYTVTGCRRTTSYVLRHRTSESESRTMSYVKIHTTSYVAHTTSYVFTSTYRIQSLLQCRTSMSEMDIRCRMYMTYDIVCSYLIRHCMYARCRMSTYDIVCQTYNVVRLPSLEVAVSAVLADPLPTAQANERCLSDSRCRSFIFSFATSKTVSETRTLWFSRTLKKGCGCCPQASPPDQRSVHTTSGSVRELHSTNLGAAGQFFHCHPRGWRRVCCTCTAYYL
jgi:hypothetical protein